MPAKFRAKEFIVEGIYHIYNKAAPGRTVFTDTQDYETFIRLCQQYLSPIVDNPNSRFKAERPYRTKHKKDMNLSQEIEMWAYCLMPDNVQFLIKQHHTFGITKFMRRVMTGYAMYFNKKSQSRGGLWEGVYKAIKLNEEKDIIEASRLIHLNSIVRTVKRFGPLETVSGIRPEEYPFSSFRNYVNEDEHTWVYTLPILKFFDNSIEKYQRFIESRKTTGQSEYRGFS